MMEAVTFWATIIGTILASILTFASVVWGKNRERGEKRREEASNADAAEIEFDVKERQNLIDNMRTFNKTLQDRILELDAKLTEASKTNQGMWTKIIELERRINELEYENARLRFISNTAVVSK